MQITITLNTDHGENDIRAAIDMLSAYIGPVSESAQPAVASNTGNIGSGLSLSPEANVVVGASVPGAEPETKDAPTVVKERKPRADKGTKVAVAPVGERAEAAAAETPSTHGDSAGTPSSAPAAAQPTPLSLDSVRAALQAYTGVKGVPAGIELLGEFNAKRISELKADDYAAFVEKCGGAA